MNKMTAFVPCRSGSQRIKHKNIRSFCGIEGGLTKIKIAQLLAIPSIDTIFVSTNDSKVIEIALSFSSPKIVIDERPEHLCSSSVSTNLLLEYISKIIITIIVGSCYSIRLM